jgi:tetratricopeptide (TPR) repeat protein
MQNRTNSLIISLALKAAVISCIAVSARCIGVRAQEISPEVRQHFAAAREAQNAGSLEKAVEECLAVIHLQPGFAEAYSNLGLVYYVQGKFPESASALSRSLEIKPTIVGANLYLGIDYVKLGKAEKAIPYLRRAAILQPENKDAQSWLGTAYWDAGQMWPALLQLRQTEINYPNDPDIMFVLGEAYRKAADQELEVVIRRASGTAYVHEVFGNIYLEQNELAKATGHYRRALELDPSAAHIHFDLGEVSLRGEHLDEAEQEYLLELRTDPTSATSKARLAEIYLLKGDVSSSLQMLTDAINVSPEQAASALRLPPSFATNDEHMSAAMLTKIVAVVPELQSAQPGAAPSLALATVAARTGQERAFLQYWAQFRAAVPIRRPSSNQLELAAESLNRQSFSDAEVHVHDWLNAHPRDLKGLYLAARIHRDLSLAMLDRLLKAFPDSYRSHQLLAQTFEHRDEDDKAIAEYKKTDELAPGLPGVHFAIGHLLLKEGDSEGAAAELNEELKINPEHPEANAEMGLILISRDQTVSAVEYLEKATSLQPDLCTAHAELGKAYYLQKNYAKSVAELKLAVTDDPEGAAHYQLGLAYKALGQSDDSQREFEASRKIKADRLSQMKIEMPEGPKGD